MRKCTYRDKIDEFYKFLKGEELPEGMIAEMPKLTPELAFTIIWYLQEHFRILPDNIEQCEGCKELFDSYSEGYSLSDDYIDKRTGKTLAKKYWGHWCEECAPNVDFELK